MRTFVQRQKQSQQIKSTDSKTHGRAFSVQNHVIRSILHLQRTIGNQAVLRSPLGNGEELETGSTITASTRVVLDFSQIPLHSTTSTKIRPKLTISTPGGLDEQEADLTADQVMQMREPKFHRLLPLGGGCPKYGGQAANYGLKPSMTKRIPPNASIDNGVPPIVHEVVSVSGQPLDPATRGFMEQRFGHDFSRIHIHTDAKAAEAAKSITAKAFTVGEHVAFAPGEFNPQTLSGKRLLAHELSHVIQQRRTQGGAFNAGIVYRHRADHPYSDSVTFDRIDRRDGIHWGITVHIPREINGVAVNLQTAIACIQAALRMDVQRRRVSRLVGTNETLIGAVGDSLDRQISQDTIDIVVRYSRQPERENRVSSLQILNSGPISVEEAEGPEEREEEQTPVSSCPSWIPVDDAYVEERILELLVRNNGDTRSAFHEIRAERNRTENCCNLNHTAIEHYFDFRAQVGEGEESSGYAHIESTAGAIARVILTPAAMLGRGRTGNCPPSPPSAAVIGWEHLGIIDGERDFETTPPERGVSRTSMSSSEFLRIRLLNTRSDRRERIERIRREIEGTRPGSIVSTPR